MLRRLHLFLIGVVLLVLLSGCDRVPAFTVGDPITEEVDALPDTVDVAPSEDTGQSYLDQLRELYDRAKGAGEEVPGDVMEWAKGDAQKIGDWDYKVVGMGEESVEEQLNALGEERWECFWVEPLPEGKRFYFKRPVRSYLQVAGKAAGFVPLPGGGGN